MFCSGEKNKSIHNLFCLLVSVFSILTFTRCEDENANPRSYPRVTNISVTDITEKGAVFSADITSVGTEIVIQHGFVWGVSSTPTINYENRVLLGSSIAPGSFRAEIHTTLRKGVKYTVKPFIKTIEHTVYGAPSSFLSLGSEAPVIESFEPRTARWLDTLLIKGKNFSYLTGENVVRLNNAMCFICSSTDTTLRALVSTELTAAEADLSVSIADNVATYSGGKFNLILPVINGFSPKLAWWGDMITVYGKYLYTSVLEYTYSGKVGGIALTFYDKKDNYFLFRVPAGVNLAENLVELKINGINYQLPDKLNLISPVISGIRPNIGTWGTVITIIGKFHPTKERNLISIGGYSTAIISFWGDSLSVAVPTLAAFHDNVVKNDVTPFSIVSPVSFTLNAPLIQSVSPLSGPSGTLITITGNYLYNSTSNTSVRFGSIEAAIVSQSPTTITCKVPVNMLNGPVNLTVTVKSQSTVHSVPFVVDKNPYITAVSPLNGTFNDEITITGENFIVDATTGTLSISGKSIPVKTITPTQIVFVVPTDLDSTKNTIQVTVGPRSNIFSGKFILSPPVFNSITPSEYGIGDEVVISGSNFNPVASYNKLYFGKYELPVTSVSPTLITAKVPDGFPRGNYRLKLTANGFKKSSLLTYPVKSQWLSLPIQNSVYWNTGGPTWDNDYGYSFVVGGNGYILYNDNNFAKYNPALNTWTNIGYYWSWTRAAANVVVLDQFYIIYGSSYFQKYSPENNTWKAVAGCPVTSRYGVAFGIDNKIYFGLGVNSISDNTAKQDFWECDVSDNHKWTQKESIPSTSPIVMGGYFTIGSTGYALLRDNSLWAYNPNTNTWSRKADFPGLARTICNAVIVNNKGLVGSGKKLPSTYFSDFWFYDPTSDSWSAATNIYKTRYSILGFAVNNKAYFGYGHNATNTFTDFYEYDPNYTLK